MIDSEPPYGDVPDDPLSTLHEAGHQPLHETPHETPHQLVRPADEADDVLEAVARLWRDVAKDEEARFSGLNARALGVLSVSGLVVSIGALFTKDLLTQPSLSSGYRWVIAVSLAVALVVLLAAALMVVLGVLLPRRIPIFGNNALTTNPDVVTTVRAVNSVIRADYSVSALEIQKANRGKAAWLERSYLTVLVAVAAITVAGVVSAAAAVLDPA